MVTWLHFWIIAIMSMGFAVTDMVTNGYNGYKHFSGYNESAKQGHFLKSFMTLSLFIWLLHLTLLVTLTKL